MPHPAGTDELIFEEEGPLARITFNRPERRNALSRELSDSFVRAVEYVRASMTSASPASVWVSADSSACRRDAVSPRVALPLHRLDGAVCGRKPSSRRRPTMGR